MTSLTLLFLYYIKQENSMLSFVCPSTDHTKRNTERECPTSVLQMTGCPSQYF